MTDTIVISLPYFSDKAEIIARFLHADRREYTTDAFGEAFQKYRRIVAILSIGIAIRALSPLIRNKWEDPAVVVISPDMHYAVPILGGHHGANQLAKELGGAGIVPVITTATEVMGKDSVEGIADRECSDIVNRHSTRAVNAAMLEEDVPVYTIPGPAVVLVGPAVSVLLRRGEYTIGIGCRKGTPKEEVISALNSAFSEAYIEPPMVLAYATTLKKKGERGLREAISQLSGNLIYIDDQTINAQVVQSSSKAKSLGLQGVAEPCALALSKHKELVMAKKIYGGVTIAIAR
ncbi:MAG: cobalt-precorrin 5A hydrolase [Methanomicrobiales archaeon]|nr:cobalt-precorrin 5A hydrolase [Methanomicrobiales archaeon]